MRSMASVASLLVLVLAVVPAMATDYTVGDSSGWTTPYDYTSWVSDKSFKVGDTLVFQYSSLHSVNEVSKSDYDSCSSSNAVKSYSSNGNTKISLDKAGSRYFICGTPGHCSEGMKLAVAVGSGSGGTPSTPASGGSTPTTPSSPSGTKSPAGSNAATAGSGLSSAVVVGMAVVGGLALMG